MASTATCQTPNVDYFSLLTQRPQNTTPVQTFPSTYSFALTPPESCDETTPQSPVLLNLPAFPKSDTTPPSDQIFNFGSFDDWMGWDENDPADNALSPASDYFPSLKTELQSPKLSQYRPQSRTISQVQDDASAVFGADPISEEPLFQTSPLFTTSEPTQNLYSTPLSWSTPAAGISRPPHIRLSAAEIAKLQAIAMPSFNSTTKQTPSSTTSPEPLSQRRKRKPSISDDDDDLISDCDTHRKAPKKTAHNMIEKRYRTNLNDKIAALRDSVPSLRVVSKGSSKDEDLDGLTPAHKLNKATVLSKATEYITHLEKRTDILVKENAQLSARVDAFEILMRNQQASQQSINPHPSDQSGFCGYIRDN